MVDLTPWKIAMLAIAVLLFFHDDRRAIFRTWLAMLASSILAFYANKWAAGNSWLFGSYLAIDTMAAVVVLARPAGLGQKAIGLCYFAMVALHIGALVGLFVHSLFGFVVGTGIYDSLQVALGWAQFAILCLWGGWGVGKSVVYRFWPHLRMVAGDEVGGTR